MSKAQHTSKVSESRSAISLIARIKAFLGIDCEVQEINQNAILPEKDKFADPATHDSQKIWKRQIGAILPHRKSEATSPTKHDGDGDAK